MNIKNTIKKDLQSIGLIQKIYAEYLGVSEQCLSYRLNRKETLEERNEFEAFLQSKGINLKDNKEVSDIKE